MLWHGARRTPGRFSKKLQPLLSLANLPPSPQATGIELPHAAGMGRGEPMEGSAKSFNLCFLPRTFHRRRRRRESNSLMPRAWEEANLWKVPLKASTFAFFGEPSTVAIGDGNRTPLPSKQKSAFFRKRILINHQAFLLTEKSIFYHRGYTQFTRIIKPKELHLPSRTR